MRTLLSALPVILLLTLLAACVGSQSADDAADDATDDAVAVAEDPTPTPEADDPEPTATPEPEPTEIPEPEPTEPPVAEATATPEPDDGNGEPTEHIIEIQDPHDFVPDELEVAVGDTITWVNTGNIVHTSTLDPEIAQDESNAQLPEGADTWDSGDLEPGDEFSITLEVPGEYVYFCRPHEVLGQIGTITVTGNGEAVDGSDDEEADTDDPGDDDAEEDDD
jgi:plastocyanin